MPITAQVVKYPSARALALGRGLWELKNRMVRRSKGGAIEPPMARTISLGRESLMNILLAVVRSMQRSTDYRRLWISKTDHRADTDGTCRPYRRLQRLDFYGSRTVSPIPKSAGTQAARE
jgi:hypothetical protein